MKDLARTTPSNDLAPAPAAQGARRSLQPQTFAEARQLAQAIAGTPFAAGLTAEGALAAMVTGSELGLTAMQALRAFSVIKGKPTLAADAMVAIVRASGLCEEWETVETTPTTCTITTRRRGSKRDQTRTWTIEDARRARLGGDAWAHYPAQMLRHRCATDLARDVYPDVLLGIYAPDELSEQAPAPSAPSAYAQPVEPQHVADLAVALQDCDGVRAAGALWQRMSRDLHAADATDEATAVLADWLVSRGYDLTASEQHGLCTGTWGDDLCLYLDGLAVCAGAADARTHYLAHKGAMDAWGERDRTVARRNTVRAVMRLKPCGEADAKRYLAGEPPRPDTSTDTASTIDEARASRERVESKGGPEAYLATKNSRREVESAVRRHGRHVQGLLPAAVDRLDALTPADADGTRVAPMTLRRLVETWASEGPKRNATATAATTRHAA